MLQRESRPDRAFPGKIIISHTRVTFLHASGNSVPKQGKFLLLAIGKRSTGKERILELLQPLNRCQNLEYARRSWPLSAGINADNPGNSCILITRDPHGWSGTKWEPTGLPCQVSERLSTAPLPTHSPRHAADAHTHPFFICFPKDAVLPGKEFPNRTTLFRKSSTLGKVKVISEKPSYSLKQKQNCEEQRGRSMFSSGRAAVSVGSYTSRLVANKSQDWAIKVLVHGRKMTCYWQLIVSNSSSQAPNLTAAKGLVASTRGNE